jgi:SulP family sulfate permease
MSAGLAPRAQAVAVRSSAARLPLPIGQAATWKLPAGVTKRLPIPGACRAWEVESVLEKRQSQNQPQRGSFLPDLQPYIPALSQEDGEKWTAAGNLQPTLPKSDGVLANTIVESPALHHNA